MDGQERLCLRCRWRLAQTSLRVVQKRFERRNVRVIVESRRVGELKRYYLRVKRSFLLSHFRRTFQIFVMSALCYPTIRLCTCLSLSFELSSIPPCHFRPFSTQTSLWSTACASKQPCTGRPLILKLIFSRESPRSHLGPL